MHLLHLLDELFASGEMPAGHRPRDYEFLGNTIIRQLTELKELRAIPLLKQIAELDGALTSGLDESPVSRTTTSHTHLGETAQQALRELEE